MENTGNWINEGKTEMAVGGYLGFYDDQGKLIESVPFSENFPINSDRIQTINVTSIVDLSKYKAVTLLGVSPIPLYTQVPPSLTVSDEAKQVFIGDIEAYKLDGFTRFDGAISLKIDGTYNLSATLIFFDSDGKEIGKAPLKIKVTGKKTQGEIISTFTVVGKGDLTSWKSVHVTVDGLTPVIE